jgi:hypothetical protein
MTKLLNKNISLLKILLRQQSIHEISKYLVKFKSSNQIFLPNERSFMSIKYFQHFELLDVF